MPGNTENQIHISVRNLVEFLLKSGDIDRRRRGRKEIEAMAAGTRIHKKIQGRAGGGYQAEVPLRWEFPEEEIVIVLEGRADGIFEKNGIPMIDEIKGVYKDVEQLSEPVPVHRAQAMFYAYMLLLRDGGDTCGIQLTYCNLDTEEIRRFEEILTAEEIEVYCLKLIREYANWGMFLYEHRMARNETLGQLSFPYEYRAGQKELALAVYRSISRKKNLFIQAPTGIGKTMAVLYPSVRAMGMGLGEKVFYLTAKTITRTVAEEAAALLRSKGARLSSISFTAREKLCPLVLEGGVVECNPEACPYAKGHFDRVNEAVFDYIHQYETAGREEILSFAKKYQVCPHEFSLDLSDWFDVIICDYNYVFDPNVQLKRYFSEQGGRDYLFLADEAHNMVDRAREMYSAALCKEEFLTVKKLVKEYSRKLERLLERCNKLFLQLKRESDEPVVLEKVDHLIPAITAVYAEMEKFQEDFRVMDGNEDFGNLYLHLRHFLNMYERLDDSYVIYTEHVGSGSFMLRLFCVHPAKNISLCLEHGVSSIFFSATLLPVNYYKELICGSTEEYAIYVPSPFDREKRFLAAGRDVSSRYTRRSQAEYEKVLDYILEAAKARCGNYLVYLPSYRYMQDIYETFLKRSFGREDAFPEMALQEQGMNEAGREAFLARFEEKRERSFIALCVMGGVFSEGIDLTGERLIGALVVGPGLPQLCTEREMLRQWYEKHERDGFVYAYRIPGMNKVLQAAGRVIRTDTDTGVILLLDDRFTQREYRQMFPREWSDLQITDKGKIQGLLAEFWKKTDEKA